MSTPLIASSMNPPVCPRTRIAEYIFHHKALDIRDRAIEGFICDSR